MQGCLQDSSARVKFRHGNCLHSSKAARQLKRTRILLDMTWLFWAILSAVFAAATALLAKVGVAGIDSNLATAIRTSVILVFTWAIAIGFEKHHALGQIGRRSWVFLVLSGICTGLSWLCYFRALQMGPASSVAPIDKLSVVLVVSWCVALSQRAAEPAEDWRRIPDHDWRGDSGLCITGCMRSRRYNRDSSLSAQRNVGAGSRWGRHGFDGIACGREACRVWTPVIAHKTISAEPQFALAA